MSRLYEAMFLIDNDAVRAGWAELKAGVSAVVEKHGGKIRTARRWDERKLAYPIKHRKRATYLLAYCELPEKSMSTLSRELEIDERVLRYLLTRTEEVPAKELELASAEEAEDFLVPEPPSDDEPEQEPEPPRPQARERTEGAPAGEKPAEEDDAKAKSDENAEAAQPAAAEPAQPAAAEAAQPAAAEAAQPATAEPAEASQKED